MNRIEALIEEYGGLTFHFKNDMPIGLNGLISNKNIYVNAKLPFEKIYATLTEEIGHYETAHADIIDQSNLQNRKLELKGRKWSYKKMVPYDKLRNFIEMNEMVYPYEIAEEFGIPDDIVEEAISMYRIEGYL